MLHERRNGYCRSIRSFVSTRFLCDKHRIFHLSYSVYLASLNPHWLLKPSQRLYPEVADQYNTNPPQVVRNIDGFACASWCKNAAFLRSLTCRPLMTAPTAAQFLRMLVHYIRRRYV